MKNYIRVFIYINKTQISQLVTILLWTTTMFLFGKMGNKRGELKTVVHLGNFDLIAIMETW